MQNSTFLIIGGLQYRTRKQNISKRHLCYALCTYKVEQRDGESSFDAQKNPSNWLVKNSRFFVVFPDPIITLPMLVRLNPGAPSRLTSCR